jgi:hypothetical protein
MTTEDNNNNTEPTMGEKPETAQDRLDALRIEVDAAKEKQRAHELGFDNLDDYAQWLVLEDLRHLTIHARDRKLTGGNENPVSADEWRFAGRSSVGKITLSEPF